MTALDDFPVDTLEDMPAYDIPAERAVLGSMMLSADALAECLEILAPVGADGFFRPAHQIAYEAIRDLADDAKPVDVLTVKAELEGRDEIGRIGGSLELHTMIAAVPVAANGAHYARKLLQIAMLRSLRGAGITLSQLAAQPGDLDRAGLADRAHEILDQATGLAVTTEGMSVAELLGPALDTLQAGPDTTKGILTGWHELDRVIPGFRGGEVVIIGGRPGMGKSVVLINVATQVGVYQQRPVLFRSLEMSRGECMDRILSSVAGVELTAIRDRTVNDHDWDRIAKVHDRLSAAGTLVINDSPDVSIQGIRAELRAMRRSGNPAAMLIVDYLQLMTASGKRPESRQLEVSDMSRSLKKLAKEFDIPVLVGSQLNRDVEKRQDKRPMASDLRESGSLEQDSDIVILLYRDDEYVEDSPRAGEIDMIIAKNRQGPKVTVQLAFRGHYAMCADLYREDTS